MHKKNIRCSLRLMLKLVCTLLAIIISNKIKFVCILWGKTRNLHDYKLVF